jgi:hypothetical protein
MVGGKLDFSHILIGLPNGSQQLIPIEWTDQVEHRQSPPGALFVFEHLVLLRQRLNQLLAKNGQQAILSTGEPVLDLCGGSDVNQSASNPVGTNEPGTTRPDHCHPSADAAAAMDPGNRGTE